MLKTMFLSGALLIASTSLSMGGPRASSAAGEVFELAVPPAGLLDTAESTYSRTSPKRIMRAEDGLFYVNATVNGKAVRFVVDTGSNVVVLTKRDAARVGMAPSSGAPVGLKTVGGAVPMQRGSIDLIVVAGQAIENVDSARVDSGLKVSLLGQSALSRLKSVSFAGDRLELH